MLVTDKRQLKGCNLKIDCNLKICFFSFVRLWNVKISQKSEVTIFFLQLPNFSYIMLVKMYVCLNSLNKLGFFSVTSWYHWNKKRVLFNCLFCDFIGLELSRVTVVKPFLMPTFVSILRVNSMPGTSIQPYEW